MTSNRFDVRIADLATDTWEVFDEFVLRIGSDGVWEFPVILLQFHYEDLVDAGLLTPRLNYALDMYGLTEIGRREVCSRGGHDFDRNRPAADGCSMCDAVVCPDCSDSGPLPVDCTGCDNVGLVSTDSRQT